MEHIESRLTRIEILAGNGNIDGLKEILELSYTQLEIDVALENAIAYSQIKIAEYLLTLGADMSNYNYQGMYYAVHNNELEGLKFTVSQGVDINVNNGMLLNTSVMTTMNTNSIELATWLINNGANPKLLTSQSLKLIDECEAVELKKLIEIS